MNVARQVSPDERRTASPAADPLQPARSLWISWNAHRRTTGLCAAWGVPLHVIRPERGKLRRWIERAVLTLKLLKREKPEILFVQNPSLALTLLATLVRPFFGYYLVVDAHNEGVRPFDRPGAVVGWLTRRLLKAADTTIVTNAALAKDVAAAGGRPLVLTDRLPEPPAPDGKDQQAEDAPQVAVIATFRPDEPIEAILAAAAAMPGIRIAFSGPSRRFAGNRNELPPNVRLAGFLLDPAYWRFLARADVVCDLTLKPDCLVCGAYEGLALGKAMVLSDNQVTRETFGPAAMLTGNEPEAIAGALRKALGQRARLEANARDLREAYRARWPALAAAAWDDVCARALAGKRGVV